MSQGRDAKLLTLVLKTGPRNAFVSPVLKAPTLHQHLFWTPQLPKLALK